MTITAPSTASGLPFEQTRTSGEIHTDYDWAVQPSALTDFLCEMQEVYGSALPPVFITENGAAYDVAPQPDGEVNDALRIEYLDSHIRAVADAIDRGVDVAAYYTWSLLDDFEWNEGYTKRFGLIHVDFETLARTPKRSFQWYAQLITSQKQSRLSS